jgi:hypothetical protein
LVARPIDVEDVRRTFTYDNGRLYWRDTPLGRGLPLTTPAGNVTLNGYVTLGWRGKKWAVHRLIFVLCNGHSPPDVDHINGNRADNRPENLRAASRSDNLKNSRIRSDSTSGVKGVHWDAQSKKWRASVKVGGKKYYVGSSDNPAALVSVLREAREHLHGQFANHGSVSSV